MRDEPHILIVDDATGTARNRMFLHRALNIHLVANPSLALQVANANEIDVIVIDFSPVEISSIGLSILFKESQVTRNIPIVILTDKPEVQRHAEELRFCGIDYLPKSSTDDVFIAKMHAVTETYKRAKTEQNRNSSNK